VSTAKETFTYERVYDELLKNFVGIAAPSSETITIEGSQASAYWVQRDETEERVYDELSRNFIGIPFLTSASNELTENLSRLREEQKIADRQENLKDMIRYWNQFKK
jgi:hypothetical protein